MDDAVLLTRARRGDESAFSLLFSRHERQIYRYAAYMCGPHAGDDVVQDTFLAVLRQSGRGDNVTGSVISYLLGIARHAVMKRLAANREVPFVEIPDEDTWSPRVLRPGAPASGEISALDALTKEETATAVRAAVQTLPAAYREVVVLCELQEMDYEATAALIACPIGTVRSRLHRARRLLAAKLAALRDPVRRVEGSRQ